MTITQHNQANGIQMIQDWQHGFSSWQLWQGATYRGCINESPDDLCTLEDASGQIQLRSTLEECQATAQSCTWWMTEA